MEFKNVTIVKKANVYFNGKVTSRTVLFSDGSKKTLGVMLAGDYEFKTGAAELMDTLGGAVEIQLADQTDWREYKEGESYSVPANSSFKLKVKDIYDYCCTYIS